MDNSELTKREYFAAQAMQALIGIYDTTIFKPAAPGEIAERAYLIADEMLKEQE